MKSRQTIITLCTIWAVALLLPCVCAHAADQGGSSLAATVRIDVSPPRVALTSSRGRVQLIVTGYAADASAFDVTHAASMESDDPSVATVDSTGSVHPVENGSTNILIEHEGQTATVAVSVSDQAAPAPIRFGSEVLAVLTKQGCNAGSCHGSPHGKNGFQLSMLAYSPAIDAESLIYDGFARRINRLNPDESLLLRKPTLSIPHGGHKKLRKGTLPYEMLRTWIAEGARDDGPDEPNCTGIDVTPGERRTLQSPHLTQQLAVRASFSDGTSRDVTHLVKFDSSHEDVAAVSATGLVTGKSRGDAAVSVRFLNYIRPFSVTVIQPQKDFAWAAPPEHNDLDRLVNNKLRQLQYPPSGTCSDEVFVRRVYLDVIGLLPTVDETRRFLSDASPDKRANLIDALLNRPEHARFWAQKTADLMRVNASSMADGRADDFSQWLATTINDNMPFDRFAETLLTASGDTSEHAPASYFAALPKMEDCAEATAQLFMGSRVQCARCHNHPFENWTQDDYYRLAAVFARVDAKPTRVRIRDKGEATQPATGKVMEPWGAREDRPDTDDAVDRRSEFASWLTSADNPYFAKVEVNRIWSHLLGRGIVEPVDDFRLTNPPANEELLDTLAADFVAGGYDRRHILTKILNSQSYQRSAEPKEGSADEHIRFSHARIRLLSAEQLHDAIGRVTMSLPPNDRAIDDRTGQAESELEALLEKLKREQPLWEGAGRFAVKDVPRMTSHWFGLGPFPIADVRKAPDRFEAFEQTPVNLSAASDLTANGPAGWTLHPEWIDGTGASTGGKGQRHYVCRRIVARESHTVEIRMNTPNKVTIWLNGEQVFHRKPVVSKHGPDNEFFVTINLEAGLNHLMLRLISPNGPNRFRFDLGTPGELKPLNQIDEQIKLGKKLIYGEPDDENDPSQIPPHVGVILEVPSDNRTASERELLATYHLSTEPRVEELRDEIKRLKGRLDFATQRAIPDSNEFLKAFGKPERTSTCACERTEKPTLLQALQLLNGPLVHEQVQAGAQRYGLMGDERLVETLYLAAFSRQPTIEELRMTTEYLDTAEQRNSAVEDLIWTVINTRDFLFRY